MSRQANNPIRQDNLAALFAPFHKQHMTESVRELNKAIYTMKHVVDTDTKTIDAAQLLSSIEAKLAFAAVTSRESGHASAAMTAREIQTRRKALHAAMSKLRVARDGAVALYRGLGLDVSRVYLRLAQDPEHLRSLAAELKEELEGNKAITKSPIVAGWIESATEVVKDAEELMAAGVYASEPDELKRAAHRAFQATVNDARALLRSVYFDNPAMLAKLKRQVAPRRPRVPLALEAPPQEYGMLELSPA